MQNKGHDRNTGHHCKKDHDRATDKFAAEVIALVAAVNRRAPGYFARFPLTCAADASDALRAFVSALADCLQIPLQNAARPDESRDAVTVLLQKWQHKIADEPALLDADAQDLQAAVADAHQRWQQQALPRQRRFVELPGLHTHALDADSQYHVLGDGGEAVLLVNAFGLSLDFWQPLAAALAPHYRVIALDVGACELQPGALSETYYNSATAVTDFIGQASAVLDCEQITACHLVGWCSGGKLAMELAAALPDSVRSLSLIAPSFSGMASSRGADSAYEANLLKMCSIVERMPKAAAGMASSMLSIMQKSGADLARFDAAQPQPANVLELADADQLALLYCPFLHADNMIAFSRQLMQFRAHDIQPLLQSGALQLPTLLLTGTADTTTCSLRAGEIARQFVNLCGFELAGASHYLLHQDAEATAALLLEFFRQGVTVEMPHSLRLQSILQPSSALQQSADLVCGEI